MKFVTNRITICCLAAYLSLGMSRPAAAQVADVARATDPTAVVNVEPVPGTVYRTKAPVDAPSARHETKGTAPSTKAVWVPGFWDIQGDRNSGARAGWLWVPGRWIEPPVPHARWDPGHWGWSDGWYSWIPSHWVVPGHHGYPPELQTDEMTESEMSAP